MSNKNVEEIALEICRTVMGVEKYSAEIVGKVMELVPKVISSVEIDLRIINELIKGLSEKKSANPVNLLLKPLNYQVVEITSSHSQINKIDQNKLLNVDEETLAATITEVAEFISTKNKKIEALEQRYNEKLGEYYRYRERTENQLKEYQVQRELVTSYIQYEMAQRLKNSAVYEDLTEILEYLGLKAILPEEIEVDRRAEFFTELKTDMQEGASVKPCIQAGDKIFLRGEIVEYVKSSNPVQ